MLWAEDAPTLALSSLIAELDVVFAHFWSFIISVAGVARAVSITVGVVVAAVAASSAALGAASSASASGAFSVLHIEGLLLALL